MSSIQLKRVGVIASSVFAGVLVANAAAADEGPNYTFIEAGYVHVEIDDFDADGEALALQGSVAVTDMFHLIGGYQDGTIDGPFGIDVDVSTLELGGGMNFALSPTVDFVGQVAWLSTEVDVSGLGDVDDDGYGLGAGIRAMISPRFEVGAGVNYADIADDGQTTFGGEVLYHFTDMFAVTGGVTVGEDSTSYGVGVRANLHGM